ncbi:methylthioribulose 1-phosphate dehydratase [Corallococcus sp. ZKHCc1 1396]|uniref:Methylthioribulose-1-phosphate dehydratase n=1 Tax=Corallococcus soli TaxID=2710757 RepID=A0ABR9PRP8_9BACT|nr:MULTISPECIES: methylthioribulose 1-phosphate dehydratase [Corallococcus]MBE4750602.1 methylthioribulose 1-phosphate dehydratase [Corallococcus soli]MCY1033573.1 methylthioribulose 1-phosphate dehydratase [Corallococcus sp. BB11-1]RYZ45260.1 MAG: methylthioribulose 1-phosphate dehydratase [Myxococcaceae bacterium]
MRVNPVPATPLSDAVREIVEVGRFLSVRNFVPATSGNFSRRLDARTAAVTRSGVDKGELVEADVLVADLHAPPPEGASAETPLHLQLYRDRPDAHAVLHTHSVVSALLSNLRLAEGELVLQGFELLKALGDTRTHEAAVSIPIFPNDQDIPRLASKVTALLEQRPELVAYLIAGHGLYTWGRSMAEARRHVVALEHLLTYELEKMKVLR